MRCKSMAACHGPYVSHKHIYSTVWRQVSEPALIRQTRVLHSLQGTQPRLEPEPDCPRHRDPERAPRASRDIQQPIGGLAGSALRALAWRVGCAAAAGRPPCRPQPARRERDTVHICRCCLSELDNHVTHHAVAAEAGGAVGALRPPSFQGGGQTYLFAPAKLLSI